MVDPNIDGGVGGGAGDGRGHPRFSPLDVGPTDKLGFEINARGEWWSFVPTYYPERLTQSKGRELDRDGRQCGGQNVTVKVIKNREFHVSGIILETEIPVTQKLLDYQETVDVISPLTPDGGMECHIKQAELGEKSGWDPVEREWQFSYTLDLVSTGRDEYDDGNNAIVTAVLNNQSDIEEERDGLLDVDESDSNVDL